MTPKRRVPLGKKVRRQALQESQAREAARAAKRGQARDRATYNQRLQEGVDHRALGDAMARVLAAQDEAAVAPRRRGGGGARAFPAAAPGRWVPIGPSVVRRGQAVDRPRVSGRVRDLAVDATGLRAYAATAMGGVWYTGDGGATWSPVGGWAERPRVVGGASNAQACGALLVAFDAPAAGHDFVMVGTGEPTPWQAPVGQGALGGVGVLAADRVVAGGPAGDPWEVDSGIAGLEGLGIFRLVRQPGRTPGATSGPNQDTVLACTTNGAWVGVRSALPPSGALPARNGFTWTQMATLEAKYPGASVTDAVWLPGGRLLLALASIGLVYTDDVGATAPVDVAGSQPPTLQIVGSMSLAVATGNRVYVLGETGGAPTLWQIPDVSVAAPAVNAVPGLPANLWGAQRDYDQAIAVDVVAGTDRVYVGGSTAKPRPSVDWAASLWCFDVVGGNLQATPTISGTAAPPAGAGADIAGLIGNNVHADVHAIKLAGAAPPRRQVWVGCDGGVFVSDRSGRVQTFAAVNTGMAALQPMFVRNHPVHGHLVAVGMQDNGTQVRTGDTVWDEVYVGDGGGVAFVPTAPHVLVRQYIRASWSGPVTAFRDPMTRNPGGPGFAMGAENTAAAFYSGAATVAVPASGASPAHSRLALGTDRVWISDDIGLGGLNTWQTLRYPSGAVTDGRPGVNGAATPAQLAIGVPSPTMGPVITLAWASPTELLVAYQGAIVRYTETSPGSWTTKTWRLNNHAVAMPRNTIVTDVCPVPGVRNFYVTTTGVVGSPEETVWFYSPSDDQFHRTGLRHVLDPTPPPTVVGPRDPAFAAVLDPADQNVVFVGTATGVWRGHRTSNLGAHTWMPFVNGLPQAAVQDLHCWVDPAAGAGSPRLLRAGIQSRGVWEVDLAADARRTTWIRSHATDDRRLPLAANVDPLAIPPAPAVSYAASPDIVVRPRWPRATAPSLLGGVPITSGTAPPYWVWTFQTAFRWLYPSVAANGVFTEAFGNLVALHRTTMTPTKSAVATIDAAVWNDVVGGVHVRADGTVTTSAADPLAVYRAPWHTSRAPNAAPTEIDLHELVVPPRVVGDIWDAYSEPSTVDVLLHHRDGREVPANGAFAVLAWQSGASPAALMALSPTTLLTYLASWLPGPAGAIPAGWTFANAQLPVALDGRLPRGVSFDMDLTGAGPYVLFVAFVASTADDLPLALPSTSANATVPPTTINDLVRCWPNAAARVVRMQPRPA